VGRRASRAPLRARGASAGRGARLRSAIAERPTLDRSEGRRVFGLDPATYDAARPGHPDEVYAVLRERCGLRPGSHVLEIGPGTGQVTRRLLELGAAQLVAVEPDPGLAAFLRERFGEQVDLLESTLEDAVLVSGAFDLAVAASMFHWVDEPIGLERIRRALRPGGWVAIWWTNFGDETRPDPVREALDPLFDDVPHSPSAGLEGRPSFGRDAERRLAALTTAGFLDATHEEFRWSRVWDAAGIRGLYATFSPIIALAPDRRDALLDAVERIAREDFGDHVEKPLVTSLYTGRNPR
jgi:SAM-dependent methyltransferase